MPSALPPPGDPSTLYVMDLSGFVFRAWHAVPPLTNSKGEPTHAIHGVTQMLQRLVNERRPTYLVVAVDSRGASFRKDIYPEYKSTRKERPPDLDGQVARVREIAEAYGIPCLEAEGMEADDVIATVVRHVRAAGLNVVIVSADKDLLQLVGDGVVMFDTMRDKVFGPEETIDKMGVPPGKVRDLLALTGDTSDNVPGVPSVGPKTAAQLLNDHASLDAIYASLDTIARKGVRAKLEAHKAEAYLSQQLVTLREDAPVELDLEKMRYGGADVPRLRRLLLELELYRALTELDRVAARSAGVARPERPGAPRPLFVAPMASVEPRWSVDESEIERVIDAAIASGTLILHSLIEGDDALRAPLVGVAVGVAGEAPVYVPLGHVYLGRPSQPSIERVSALLERALGDESVATLAHDLKREALIWDRHGARVRGSASDFDVMLGSYLIGAEGHAHDIEDVARTTGGADIPSLAALLGSGRNKRRASELEVEEAARVACARLAAIAHAAVGQRAVLAGDLLESVMRDIELPLARVLTELEETGIAVDLAHLGEISATLEKRATEMEARCHALAGHEFNVASPRALETVLFDELGLPALKKTKTGRSTDHEVLEDLAAMHELPDAILELRQIQKLRGTYVDALPKQIHPLTGRVHTRFNQAVAATGRLSSSEPNLQNIPIRTEEGRAIRHAFVAPLGSSILSADYSQIELRILAHASEDADLVDAFSTNADVHVRTATALFDVPPEEVTREQRGRAKTVNFAVIYGQTEVALARNLRIEQREARRYIDAFFARYSGVARYLDSLVDEAHRNGGVRTLLGRWRAIPDIESKNRTVRWGAERIAKNTPIQGSAADVMKRAMIAIARELASRSLRSRMLLTVHDELLLEVPDDEREVVPPLVREQMEGAFPMRVPLVVEQGMGRSWGEAH